MPYQELGCRADIGFFTIDRVVLATLSDAFCHKCVIVSRGEIFFMGEKLPVGADFDC